MRESIVFVVRVVILAVCCFALYRLTPIVVSQLKGNNACPLIGFVPACYVVFVGYLAMAFSVTMNPKKTAWLFFPGWAPVFFLALSGTSMELLGNPTCPRTGSGVPLCYFSLAISIGLLLGYLFTRGKLILRL